MNEQLQNVLIYQQFFFRLITFFSRKHPETRPTPSPSPPSASAIHPGHANGFFADVGIQKIEDGNAHEDHLPNFFTKKQPKTKIGGVLKGGDVHGEIHTLLYTSQVVQDFWTINSNNGKSPMNEDVSLINDLWLSIAMLVFWMVTIECNKNWSWVDSLGSWCVFFGGPGSILTSWVGFRGGEAVVVLEGKSQTLPLVGGFFWKNARPKLPKNPRPQPLLELLVIHGRVAGLERTSQRLRCPSSVIFLTCWY